MERGKVRVLRADRSQLQWDMIDLEGLLPADHRARIVWAFVESFDLTAFYDAIKAREGEAGRPAADPAVLLALWLYATLEGVGSARELERLVQRDAAYRWLCGGVPVNYHGLSDFRSGMGEELDRLLTQSVAALMTEGLVDLEEVIVDGTKVRAAAGKGSFVRKGKLADIERAAAERVARLKAEIEADPGASTRRRRAAAERAAREVAERASKARAALDRLEAEQAKRAKTHRKEEEAKGAPRASLSDAEARFMRFADGAIRPAYNMQIAATGKGVVLAVAASDRRNDAGLAVPMVDELERRYGQAPERLLVDTHYATVADIAALATRGDDGVLVYAPPPEERQNVKPETLRRRLAARAREPQGVKDWRRRMTDPAATVVYKRRARIELVNAQHKNRGFGVLIVRGLLKARAVALLHALAHNILVACRLRAAAA